MHSTPLRTLLMVTFLCIEVGACGNRSTSTEVAPERCALCGMRVATDSGWNAGGELDGRSIHFDAPKCLFRYREQHPTITSAWMTEYYTQQRRPAETLRFVLGTDLQGPMGQDLVPVETTEAAERMRAEHHGTRILEFSEVDSATIDDLF